MDESHNENMEEIHPVDGSFMDVSITEDVHTHYKEYRCDECQKIYRRKQHLVRHLKTHDREAMKTRCSDCNVFYRNVEAMEAHKRSKHYDMVCDICGIIFKRRRDLDSHRNSLHESGSQSASSTTCPFDGCRKTFYRKTKYQDHFNMHTQVKPNECGTCDNAFSSKYKRNEHQKVCNSSQQFKCRLCEKEFQHYASLYNHKLADHSLKSFICGCGASYKYKSGLTKHKKTKHNE